MADEDQRRAFGAALAQALSEAGMTQHDLGHKVGRSAAAVSLWTTGRGEPEPLLVFDVERVVGVRPGSLSRLLGYLPVGAKPVRSIEEAIDADASLASVRHILRAVMREARKSG